jgi:hypothetical protein
MVTFSPRRARQPDARIRENTRARDAKEKREQIKKEALESFHKAKEEFNITKYENIKVV